MKSIYSEQFIEIKDECFEIYFSIGDKDYNRKSDVGRSNIENLVNKFNLDSVKYLTQVHSSKVIDLVNKNRNLKDEEADGIVSSLSNVGIGVFYADCVPIILYDTTNGCISAVHSGWRGTYDEIVKNAIKIMIESYNCQTQNIKVIIGPHIRQCCYEVSEELKESFQMKTSFNKEELFNGRKLSLEKAIMKSLIDEKVSGENIHSINLCTCCEENIKLHSYRRDGIDSGRCYAFIVKR